MKQLAAIALNGFREASRNRITVVVFAFALVLIFSARVSLEFTVTTFERVMTDVGLGVMSFIAVGLTIFLGSGLIPKEIERRTIFMVVSKPVSRTTFVVGRLLGNLLVVHACTAVMGLLLAAQLKYAGFEPSMSSTLVAIYGLLLETTVLTALSIFFSVWASQVTTVVCTVALFVAGHMATDLYRMATHRWQGASRTIGTVLYYLIPNLDRLDFKPQATYSEVVPLEQLGQAAVYALGYSIVLTAFACIAFERRDFK